MGESFWIVVGVLAGVAVFTLLVVLFVSFLIKRQKPSNSAIDMVTSLLPGENCGACGREYCKKLAQDIVENKGKAEECPFVTFANRAKIDGSFVGDAIANVKQVAFVKCKGGSRCPKTFEYTGDQSCASLNKFHSGCKSCEYACLGCGDCAKACPFSAISITERGVAIIDPEVCMGCGNCVLACPNNLIKLIPYTQRVAVACNNKTETVGECFGCEVGCIKCMHCVEVCPAGAIKIENGVPVVIEDKCIHCNKCVKVCPNHCITRI
ncbi:MAG: 4Fe-4S dicluster domain-containing protein [Clostridia bacterium]|nr:4Fe-4S dicluster domain-containing protein [Clostridia bacterium]